MATTPGPTAPENSAAAPAILPAESSHRRRRETPRRRSALWLAVAILAVGLIQLTPTLALSYAYDDLDCLNLAADVMAGKESFWRAAFKPHNEHLMPLLRLVFHGSAAWFGIEATPFRVAVLGAHLLTAWFLGLLALRYSGSGLAALATGVAYVLPCGLSSMMLWVLVATGVPIGLLGVAGALLALASRQRLGVQRARLLAGAGCLFALSAGSGLMPLLVGPALLDEYERRRAGERRLLGPFSVFCVLAMGAYALATALLYAGVYGSRPALHLLEGVLRAAFLLALAPFRYFLPGLALPLGVTNAGSTILWASLGLALAAPVAAALVVLWRRGASRLAQVTALAAVGPLGVLLLVGAGRWNWSPVALFEADRYFFTLLLPLALLGGAVTSSVVERLQGWPARQRTVFLALCTLALGAELLLHRRALMQRVPFDVFAAHERRFEQLSRLDERLAAAASTLPADSPPLSFPDGNLWFADVHNGRVSSALLLHVIGGESPRLRLVAAPVSERDAAILNPLLAAWAAEMGEPRAAPKVVAGVLTRADAPEMVDFRTGAQEEAVVSGFYPWEGTFRWMAERGTLRATLSSSWLQLVLAAPISDLKARWGWEAISVSVAVIDEATQTSVPLGTVRIVQDAPTVYTLDVSPFLRRFGAKTAMVVLTADHTWRPSEVLSGSQDSRELSVTVLAVGAKPR